MIFHFSYLIPLCGTKLCTIGVVLLCCFYSPKKLLRTSKAFLYLVPLSPVAWNLKSQHHHSATTTLKRPLPADRSSYCPPWRKWQLSVFAAASVCHRPPSQLLSPIAAVAAAAAAYACRCLPSQMPLPTVIAAITSRRSGHCPPSQ